MHIYTWEMHAQLWKFVKKRKTNPEESLSQRPDHPRQSKSSYEECTDPLSFR